MKNAFYLRANEAHFSAVTGFGGEMDYAYRVFELSPLGKEGWIGYLLTQNGGGIPGGFGGSPISRPIHYPLRVTYSFKN